MASNPNAIFGEALATGPRQIPLSELQQQIAQTAQTRAQTANIGSEMAQRAQETAGLAQQNEARRRQLADDQAVRDTIAKYTRTVPLTAPSASMPAPGVDQDGNPLPMSPEQHAQAAAGAVQGPHTDYHGAYLDLLQQGRYAAAETMLKTHQAFETQDLENGKAKLANFEAQNKRRNEIVAGVVDADPQDQDLLAAQAGTTLQQEGLGGGVGFTKEQAKALYQLTKGAGQPIETAKATLGLTKAETAQRAAEATKAAEETKQLQLSNEAAEQFLKNPDQVLGRGGMIDQLGLNPEDARRLKGQLVGVYQMPGTPQEKATAVKGAIQAAVNSAQQEARAIREKTNPQVIGAEISKAVQTEIAKSRLAPGAVAQIQNPQLQQKALAEQAKAETDWHKAEGQANQLQNFVDLARSPEGNQVAAGILPVAVVRELVNRVNNNELKLSGGGVSIARRLENWVSKGAQGKPSEDTLRDMEAFSKAVRDSQATIYRGDVGGTNRRYGSTFDTEPPVTPQSGPATPTRPTAAQAGPPTIGGTFNGERVLKVTRVK